MFSVGGVSCVQCGRSCVQCGERVHMNQESHKPHLHVQNWFKLKRLKRFVLHLRVHS